MPEDLKAALDLQEQINRILREAADAEHKRTMALDIPKGAETRAYIAGAAIATAVMTVLGGTITAVLAVLKATGVI
jgi:hypothetical protein